MATSQIMQGMLAEFDQEMAGARKTLERVPDGKFDWKPHVKSMSMGALATHVAVIPQWGKMTLETTDFDVNPPGGHAMQPPVLKTRGELLAFFDKVVAEARAAMAAASDQALMTPWSLLSGGKPIFTMPRVAVLRAMILNHIIHHRAQLGVYLRLNDIAVPSIYGPSADEGRM